jgi:hypothetical protein
VAVEDSVGRFVAVINLIGLACGIAGGLLLSFSLTLKPSNFRLVKTGEKGLAICLDDKKVVAGFGGPLVVSDEACPDMENNGPTPQVVANRPQFVPPGIGLIILGFVLQLPAGILAIRRV